MASVRRWGVRAWLVAVTFVAAGFFAGCHSPQSESGDEPRAELRFKKGEPGSAFRDIGKRAASGLE